MTFVEDSRGLVERPARAGFVDVIRACRGKSV